MIELLTTSFLWRTIVAIAQWCSRTPPARWFRALGKLWRDSFLYRTVAGWLKKTTATEDSGLRRLFQRFNDRLQGSGYGELVRHSLCYRIYSSIFRAVKESFFFGKLLSGGFTSVLLILFAAYWPVDYCLRDVLKIAFLSSIWDELLMAVSALWLLHRSANAKRPLQTRVCSTDLFLTLYMLVGLVLLVFTRTNLAVNILGYRASMQYILAFFLVLRLLRDEKDADLMCNVMVLFATLFALHGLYQFAVGTPIPQHWTDQAEQSVRTRVFSVFSNPNIMGAYMVLFAPLTIGKAYASEKLSQKIIYWFCGLCMCGGCLFTMSRGAWFALAIAAVFFVLLVDRRLLVVMVIGGIVACFLPFVRSRILYLFSEGFRESNNRGGRAKRWSTALSYVKYEKAQAGGLGYGIFGGAVADQNKINPSYNYMYVDNYYVKILTENGIVGLSAFLFSTFGLLVNGCRSIARSTERRKPVVVGLIAGMLGILVQSFFESIWEEPYMMALFFVVAALMIFEGFFLEKERKDFK